LKLKLRLNGTKILILLKKWLSKRRNDYLCKVKVFNNKKFKIIAIPIIAIPLLEGEVVKRFLREMKKAEKERGTIDISDSKKAAQILWERSRENFVKR
jgi:hypothetical protein